MTASYTAVRVDSEYAADEWWTALRERYPDFARSLERNGAVVIASPLWGSLAALPGFEGGPAFARAALIDCGGEGERWAEVTGGTHEVFDALS